MAEFDTLDADDFINVFDNIADFEKELGIDGDISDINEQSVGDELWAPPELQHSPQRTMYTTSAIVNLESASATRFRNNHSKAHVMSKTNNNNLTHSFDRNNTTLHSHSPHHHSQTNVSASSSTSTSTSDQEHSNVSQDETMDQQNNEQAQEKHRMRQQRLEIVVDKRRRQFQDQRQRDNAQMHVLLDRIERQKQQLDQQSQLDKQHETRDRPLGNSMGSALLEAVEAAQAYGLCCTYRTRHTPLTPPHRSVTPQSTTGRHTQQEEPNLLNELDPEDPDPWTEETRHYLLLGRIKRAEYLQEIRLAKTQGKEESTKEEQFKY